MVRVNTNEVAGAYADEVRAEMARQHITAAALQRAVGGGLSSAAYQKYFVRKVRAIPSDVQIAVADVLGVRLSELWRRAEESVARPALTLTEHVERQLSPEAQAEIRRAREALAERRRAESQDS